jgi:hypothetical protein
VQWVKGGGGEDKRERGKGKGKEQQDNNNNNNPVITIIIIATPAFSPLLLDVLYDCRPHRNPLDSRWDVRE